MANAECASEWHSQPPDGHRIHTETCGFEPSVCFHACKCMKVSFRHDNVGKCSMLLTFVFVMWFVVELACSATNQQQTAETCMTNIPMLIALHCITVGIRQTTWHEKLSMQSTCPLNPFQQSYCCIAIMQWAAMPNMTRTCMDIKQKASDAVGYRQQAARCQRMHAK